MLKKYQSITTPNVEHDAANMLVEFIWLNKHLNCDIFPWLNDGSKDWSRLVAAVKKLMKGPYNIDEQQMAYYIWECKPTSINPQEFARMAVVARRLLKTMSIDFVSGLYTQRKKDFAKSGLEKTRYKDSKPKTLFSF